MKSEKKELVVKISVVVLSVLVVALAITLSVFAVKNKNMAKESQAQDKKYESALSEHNALKAQEAEEKESYENALSEKDALNEKQKSEYEKIISDLKKQIAIKKQQATLSSKTPSVASPVAPPSSSHKTIYLTFDDGPSQRTPEVLKILRDNGVKATFFFVNGKKHNHYMKDVVAEGHAIALHSYTHDYKTIYTTDEAFFNDLQQISDLVYNETGIRTKLMRFPGGGSNTISRKYNQKEKIMTRLTQKVGEMGYTYFDWNISSGDASYPSPSPAQIVENCKRLPKSDSVIVLMHDAGDKKNTVAALPEVIAYYKSLGYSFATLNKDVPPAHQRVAN